MKIRTLALIFSTLAIITVVIDFLDVSPCKTNGCILSFGSILLGVFIFSVLNLLMIFILKWLPQTAFQYWWRFARIAIPIIFVLVTIINSGIHHDPVGELQNIFDVPALILLYSIFTLGSIIQIMRGYLQAKRGLK